MVTCDHICNYCEQHDSGFQRTATLYLFSWGDGELKAASQKEKSNAEIALEISIILSRKKWYVESIAFFVMGLEVSLVR